MPKIDPTYRFIIGIIVTVAIGVSSGALVLTNAIPADWIKPVTAWCGIIAFVGSAIQTSLSAAGMTVTNRIASAAAVPGVTNITVDPSIASAAARAANSNATITTAKAA